ncbi:MAG: tetratricopeptide repeat protein [Pseudomonadota bacterium]
MNTTRHSAGGRNAPRSARSAYANCKLWRNRLQQRPDDPNTLCGLANALLDSGQREEAEFTVRSALALEPDMPDAHYVLGKLLHQRGSHVAAVAQYRHALTFGANSGDIWNDLGCSLASLGDLTAAKDAFRTALRLSPQHAEAHNNVGECLWREDRMRDAMQSFATALRLDPSLTAASLNLAAGLVRMNRAVTAVPLLKRCLVRAPDSARAHLKLGVAWQQLERFDDAVASFRAAAELAPSADAYRGLAASLAAAGQPVDAVVAYREAAALAPDDTELADAFATALLAAGMSDQALSVSHERVTKGPATTTALAAHSLALARTGVDTADDLMAFDALVHGSALRLPTGYRSLDVFNGLLFQYVSAHPTLAMTPLADGLGLAPPAAQEKIARTGPLLASAVQPVAELARQVNDAVRAYLDRTEQLGGHPLLTPPPSDWLLSARGVVTAPRSEQPRHLRPAAWLSAIYYVRLPTAVTHGTTQDGCLQLGGAPAAVDPEGLLPTCTIRPAEGQLIVFPAYLFRRTVAFSGSDSHVSIAFDIARRG